MKEKTRTLFERVIFRLIRILRDTKYCNEEEIKSLIAIIKKADLGSVEKFYMKNIKLLR